MCLSENCEIHEPKMLTFHKVQITEHIKTLDIAHIKALVLLNMPVLFQNAIHFFERK